MIDEPMSWTLPRYLVLDKSQYEPNVEMWTVILQEDYDALSEQLKACEGERDRYCEQSENNSLELLETQQECLQLIDERDHREEQINQIADVLGDSSEWSNVNDRGYKAIELASVLCDRVRELEAQGPADQVSEKYRLREQVKVLREALEELTNAALAKLSPLPSQTERAFNVLARFKNRGK